MSREQFDLLDGLELTKSEYEWLERRFENMTEAEKLKFAGAMDILHPQDAAAVIQAASQLERFSLLLGAGNDAALGKYVLDNFHAAPRGSLPYLDVEKAGRMYREEYRCSFQDGHCVQLYGALDHHAETPLPYLPTAGDYAIRVKLASRANTEGVWVGFPDCGESLAAAVPDELALALEALQVKSAGECIALDVDCCFPQLTGILAQYDSAAKLVRHAVDLGYIWAEQGQGQPYFLEKWQTVMELEDCTRLDYALDLAQNLSCYEFIPRSVDLGTFGREKAVSDGVLRKSDRFLTDCFDGAAYVGEYARRWGMSATEHGYAAWNGTPLAYAYSQPPQEQMMM